MAEASAGTGQHLRWQNARVEALDALTPTIRRITLRPQHWHQPLAGQHLDVRLTADDGYQAQRSYSLLSPPQREGVYELGIERLADGEVSPWFHDAVQVGESIEVLGPVGGHFVWRAQEAPPTLLIGGGSGVVPLLAMAAHVDAEGHALAEQAAREGHGARFELRERAALGGRVGDDAVQRREDGAEVALGLDVDAADVEADLRLRRRAVNGVGDVVALLALDLVRLLAALDGPEEIEHAPCLSRPARRASPQG